MHLAAFYGSVAASQTDLSLTPVTDPYLTIGTSGMLLPKNMRCYMTYMSGLGLTQGRINVPSLRAISLPRVNPVNKALYPVDDAPINRPRMQGPRILRSEGFVLQVTTDATAGPNATYGLTWLTDAVTPAPTGDITTIRASSTVTAVTGSWVLGTLTLEQDLPAGRYAVVGMDVVGATAIAVRLRFPGGGPCPGCLVQQAAGEFFLDTFRFGNMGSWGEFDNSLPPVIDVLGTSGAVTLTVFLDIIKVSNQN